MVSLEELPTISAHAWTSFQDESRRILGNDLIALWGYGGTIFPDRPARPGDLDTFAVIEEVPDGSPGTRSKGRRMRSRASSASTGISGTSCPRTRVDKSPRRMRSRPA